MKKLFWISMLALAATVATSTNSQAFPRLFLRIGPVRVVTPAPAPVKVVAAKPVVVVKPASVVKVRPAAPAPKFEVRPVRPGKNWKWVSGHWSWRPAKHQYVWVSGHWKRR